jgi:hypothetical protein
MYSSPESGQLGARTEYKINNNSQLEHLIISGFALVVVVLKWELALYAGALDDVDGAHVAMLLRARSCRHFSLSSSQVEAG